MMLTKREKLDVPDEDDFVRLFCKDGFSDNLIDIFFVSRSEILHRSSIALGGVFESFSFCVFTKEFKDFADVFGY
jgi:hypothetical protein